MEQMDEQERMMEEYENMTPEDWEAELRWMQQVQEEEESRKIAEEEAKKYANMSPEELQAEIDFMKQINEEEEVRKMAEEAAKDYYKNKKIK